MSDVMLKDDLEKVLAELEAQGVDLTVIKDALANSGGVVKSVQRGVITISAGKKAETATISPVDTSKAYVVPGGSISGTATVSNSTSSYVDKPGQWDVQLDLTSETTVTATKLWEGAKVTVSYQVVEFY